jgi:hypothetical protein
MPVTQAVHGGGSAPTYTRRVYYTGTDTLQEGYALCYNYDAADQTPETLTTWGDGTTVSLADSLTATPARRIQVEKPSIFNLCHFAGVVTAKGAGFTGPGYLEINMPGSVCNIYSGANTDHEQGTSSIPSGQIITVTNQSYAFKYTGLPGCGSAVVLGDVDRSSTNGLVMAELMTGQQSGGVQEIWNQGTAGTVGEEMIAGTATSLGGSVYLIPYGTIVLNLSATAAALTASLTGMLASVAQGIPLGSKREIYTVDDTDTVGALTIVCSDTRRIHGSLPTTSLGGISGTFGICSASLDQATFEWSGRHWTLTRLNNSLNLYASA